MRQDNIQMLQDTLDILEKGSYQIGGKTVSLKLSRKEMEKVEVFLPEDVKRVCAAKDFDHVHRTDRCEYGCENMDSFTLARIRKEELPEFLYVLPVVLVLNLANPVHPGGGVRNGATAQEEDLCRKSSLLLSLESRTAAAYYRYNKALNTYMGSDAVMIHPQVEIMKDEKGNLLEETVIVAVMTCAAPMLRYGMEGMSDAQYRTMMYDRITGMLKVAAACGYRYLVLGAFGCGAFRNRADVVSDLFAKALKEFDYDGMNANDMFRRIDFAVMDHTEDQFNFREFARNFADDRPNKELDAIKRRLAGQQPPVH